MICSIIRRDRVEAITFQLDSKTRVAFLAAWRVAHDWMEQGRVAGAQLITSANRAELTAGTKVLKEIGLQRTTHWKHLHVHRALQVVYLATLRQKIKAAKRRAKMICALHLLAEACWYKLTVDHLPPPVDIGAFANWQPEIQQVYRHLHAPILRGHRAEISLADADRLLLTLSSGNVTRLKLLVKNLRLMTASYRAALEHLLE